MTVGEFGDVVGQQATIHRAMTLADGWKTIPGELLLQFAGTLKTARGQKADVRGGDNHPRNGEVIRGKRHGCCRYQNASSWTSARSLTAGIVLAFHVEQIVFKDRAKVTLGVAHAVSKTATPAILVAANVVFNTTGANAVDGPFGFWIATAGAARKFIAPYFAFGGAGSATDTSATFHVSVVRL